MYGLSFNDDQVRLATEELRTVIRLLKSLGVNPIEIEAIVDDECYLIRHKKKENKA